MQNPFEKSDHLPTWGKSQSDLQLHTLPLQFCQHNPPWGDCLGIKMTSDIAALLFTRITFLSEQPMQ